MALYEFYMVLQQGGSIGGEMALKHHYDEEVDDVYTALTVKKKDIQYLIRKFLKQTNHFSVKEAKIKEDKQQLEGKTTQQLHMHQDNLKKRKKKKF